MFEHEAKCDCKGCHLVPSLGDIVDKAGAACVTEIANSHKPAVSASCKLVWTMFSVFVLCFVMGCVLQSGEIAHRRKHCLFCYSFNYYYSLVKSKPTWPCPEEVKLGAKKYFSSFTWILTRSMQVMIEQRKEHAGDDRTNKGACRWW